MKNSLLAIGLVFIPAVLLPVVYVLDFYPLYIVSIVGSLSLVAMGRYVYMEEDIDNKIELSLVTAMIAMVYGAIFISSI
jgi:hypothetical protein